ncbi:ADYC domain-containing protein [Paraliomyxa miuraensis]|uniref:ADYC domain-containing protein n=1 Tax=Paraliomyxa miuraensis TaxID=376150 RepID=UPI00224F235E|nr:ADYC domain-containing protein [Paraliomyxa miuraensis]MCX4241394.1 ADYC domain-containing protein [Paraliomyxa miuraensis]
MPSIRTALLSLPLLVVACEPEGGPDSSAFEPIDVEARCLGCNWDPPVTNTHGLNGLSVAALDTTGQMYDGWRLESVEIMIDRTLTPVYDVYVKDGMLHGVDASSTEHSGAAFVDSVWTVKLEATESTAVMTISEFTDDHGASRYTFFGGTGTPNSETYTCAEDPDTGEYSVVLFENIDVDPESGTHFERSDTIYFGCVSGAVGKAAVWGYSPWNASDDAHQAASRAVRADYCGDGTPHTVQGTALQLADPFDINEFSDLTKDTESFWTPDGATCVLTTRIADYHEGIECEGVMLPECDPADELADWPDALLWTKVLVTP